MIDINQIINQEIMNARFEGMNDLACELIKISSKGSSIPEWIENREKMIERCLEVKREYQKFKAYAPQGRSFSNDR